MVTFGLYKVKVWSYELVTHVLTWIKTTQNCTCEIHICDHKMSLGYSYNTVPGEMWTNVFSAKIGNQAQNKIMIPKFNLVNPRVYWITYRSMENPKAVGHQKPILAWVRIHRSWDPRAHSQPAGSSTECLLL